MTVITNAINNKIGGANSGVTNTLTIDNASNTASSQAQALVTVGGGTAGDPFTTYTVSGVTSWSTGIDNSASDSYVVAASTALGTTNVMTMTTGGNVGCVLGDFDVRRSNSGGDVISSSTNTSNTANSDATIEALVGGTSAGDPRTHYHITGSTSWSTGIDNSASDAYVIAASDSLGTTNVMSAATTGEINYPLQPAFLATSGATTNRTGTGTSYTLGSAVSMTEIYDQGGNFVTSGTFTAPVSGRYHLSANGALTGCTINVANITTIATSNRNYVLNVGRAASATDLTNNINTIADMDAADTASVTIQGFGEAADTDDIGASCFFCGCLLV